MVDLDRWPWRHPAWQGGRVTESVPADPSAGAVDAEEWLTLPDVAERLGVSISKVHQ